MSVLDMKEITLKSKRGSDVAFNGRLIGTASYHLPDLRIWRAYLLELMQLAPRLIVYNMYQTDTGRYIEYKKWFDEDTGTVRVLDKCEAKRFMLNKRVEKVAPEIVR